RAHITPIRLSAKLLNLAPCNFKAAAQLSAIVKLQLVMTFCADAFAVFIKSDSSRFGRHTLLLARAQTRLAAMNLIGTIEFHGLTSVNRKVVDGDHQEWFGDTIALSALWRERQSDRCSIPWRAGALDDSKRVGCGRDSRQTYYH